MVSENPLASWALGYTVSPPPPPKRKYGAAETLMSASSFRQLKPLKNTHTGFMKMTISSDGFCFVSWCTIMLEVAIRRWVCCVLVGMYMVSNNAQIGCGGPSQCAKKTFPTPLHHRHQPGLLTQGRLAPWVFAVAAKFCPYHLYASAEMFFPVFNCEVLVSLCPLQPQLSVLD